ncbi:response regulator transcription factor [Pseudomonas sp. NPDC087612]|uniref:response regulator n=1 Tax=Pseudomonas sp. NPDC087612 TaxID=3364441 RepID=UPI003826726A
MYSAMVVDDHPFIRSTVRMILKQEGFDVISEADNGVDAFQLLRDHKPDLVLLDISMPRVDGLEFLSRIADLGMPVKILVLTSLSPHILSMRCMKAGAAGYVSKADDLTELVKAINAVMLGYTYFPNLKLSSVCGDNVQPQC